MKLKYGFSFFFCVYFRNSRHWEDKNTRPLLRRFRFQFSAGSDRIRADMNSKSRLGIRRMTLTCLHPAPAICLAPCGKINYAFTSWLPLLGKRDKITSLWVVSIARESESDYEPETETIRLNRGEQLTILLKFH